MSESSDAEGGNQAKNPKSGDGAKPGEKNQGGEKSGTGDGA